MLPHWLESELRDRWETLREHLAALRLREWINANPRIMIGIALASGGILLLVLISQLSGPKTRTIDDVEKEWYYDLNTKKLFIAKKGLTTPIEAPSGPTPNGKLAGVRAFVMTYEASPGPSDHFIAFLEITDPNAPPSATDSTPQTGSGLRNWARGKLISRVDDPFWVVADSPLGLAILKKAFAPNENGDRPHYLPP